MQEHRRWNYVRNLDIIIPACDEQGFHGLLNKFHIVKEGFCADQPSIVVVLYIVKVRKAHACKQAYIFVYNHVIKNLFMHVIIV